MGLMTYMRSKMHIILFTLLVLFVLSMTIGGLVGGANITDILSGKKPNVVGSVEGKDLDYNTFASMVQNEFEKLRQQGKEITSQTADRIRSQVWNSFVRETILQHISEDLGLKVTDDEIYYVLKNNPPDFITQNEYFQTDGKFDYQKYLQALNNPVGDEWYGVESYIRMVRPIQKVQNLLYSLSTVSKEEIKLEYIRRNISYTADLLYLSTSMLPQDSIEVKDEEIEKYYQENKDKYYVEEERKIRYFFLKKSPSHEDSLSVYTLAEELKKEIEEGGDFAEIAERYTEDPSGKGKGGSLGWFSRGKMVKPFEEAAFAARKGEIVGPVLTQFGYHLIKVEDRRGIGKQEEIKASHILLKITPGPTTLEKLKSKANLFSFFAREYGMEAAADSFGVQLEESAPLRRNTPFVRGIGYFPEAAHFAFQQENVGAISDLTEIDQGYVIMQLSEIIPEHIRPLEEVRERIIRIVKSEKAFQKIQEIAETISASLDSSTDWKTVADKNPLVEYTRVKDQPLNKSINGIPRSDVITGAVFSMEKGKISPILNINNRTLLILKLIDKSEFNQEEYKQKSNEIALQLMRTKRSNFYNMLLNSLKENADIKDYRQDYF